MDTQLISLFLEQNWIIAACFGLTLIMVFINFTGSPISAQSPENIVPLINKGSTLIDIRDPKEYAQSHIAGALNIPLASLTEAPQKALDHPQPIILYCKTGTRSTQGAQSLLKADKSAKIITLQGGLEEWKRAQYPIQKTTTK